jgi:hypothetical protein
MFGEIGDRRVAAWLEEVLDEDDKEEVKEAAKKALDSRKD